MPDAASLGCVAWDKREDWLCCGADGGLVKVIRMSDGPDQKSSVSTSTLEGHRASQAKVIACCWNEVHRKLTTADESGLIIVWAQQRSQWHEEMTNNRQQSRVSDMHWAPDGSRICIAYEDGAVIVGKVDGTRVWGKELGLPLDKLAWSPSCQNILFTTKKGQAYVYDADGNQVSIMPIACMTNISSIADIQWCVQSSCSIQSIENEDVRHHIATSHLALLHGSSQVPPAVQAQCSDG
jgi:WD repeat-containing protein 35